MPTPVDPPVRPTETVPSVQVDWCTSLVVYTYSEWQNLTGTADDRPEPEPQPEPPPVPDPQPARPTVFAVTVQQRWLLDLRQWAVDTRARISSGG